MRRALYFVMPCCVVVATIGQTVSAPPALASSLVTLKVVIERVDEQGCTDNLSGSDFYGEIEIAGEKTDFGVIDGEDTITPNWTAQKQFDVDAVSSAPVIIRVAESDGGLNFGDDACDITRNAGTDLDLTVNLVPCNVTGDTSGPCATSLFTGGSGDGDGDADVNFRVDVIAPAAAPGLNLRCTHSPLWPQPGQNVTITLEAFDGNVRVGDTQTDTSSGAAPPLVDHTKIVDHLEIWVGSQSAPAIDTANKTKTTFTVNNVAAGDLVYGCRIKDDNTIFSGWRRTRVGPPASGKGVPVIYLGDRAHNVDIVFIPDTDSYSGTNDPNFLSDAADVIKGAYYGEDYFLKNQPNINFWLADQTGDADSVPAPTPADPNNKNCVLTLPANWATDYMWRDSGAVLHRDSFRDCANSGVFSSEPTSLGTVLHETGHSPFGLADEYCCDGGYFENSPNPDLWDTLAECQSDATALGRPTTDCRTITDSRPTPPKNWYTSEPTPNDLMNGDRRPPQAADIRRMDWFFGNCAAGKC